jgi:ADP-ribose pyrophosphatase YjhB (NUDIX family)
MSAGTANFVRRIPEGEDRERLTCAECGFIAYENPKIVTGSVVEVEGRILLCRRAIEPRRGFWTIPAGYMELGETVEEAARREAMEEACADIALDGVLALYSIARIGQVQVLFRARLATPGFAPGPESLDVRLFAWDEIPWEELAFPSVRWVLTAWREAGPGPLGPPRTNPPEDLRGTRRLPEGA